MPTYRYHLTPKEVERVKYLLAEGVPPNVIAARMSVSSRTICYYKTPLHRGPGEPKRKTRGPATGTAFVVLNPVVVDEESCTTPSSSPQP